MFLLILNRRLNGLPLREWSIPIFSLIASSFVAGTTSWVTLWATQQVLGSEGFIVQLLQLTISGLVGLAVFAAIALQMKLPEVDLVISRLRQRFAR